MFNGIFETQMQAAMMRAMAQMAESFTQRMQAAGQYSTASTSSANSFSAILEKAAAPQAALTSNTATGSGKYEELILAAASQYGVDPALVRAVIRAESNFNPNAVSSVGATGLMQLMPGTARGLGVVNSLDPQQNIDGGTRLLSSLLKRYQGSVALALAAYNAGPGAVDRYGGIPPYRETQTYVQRILGYLGADMKGKG